MSRSGIKPGNALGRPSRWLRQNSGGFDARVSGAPEKLTANQWKIISTSNVGDILDFFDFFLIGYVLSFILREWELTYGQ
jgi:hypothetical protein